MLRLQRILGKLMVCPHEPASNETPKGMCLRCLLEDFCEEEGLPISECPNCGGIIILEPIGYGVCHGCEKLTKEMKEELE